MDSKGLITPEKFRRFCNCVVPLFRAKRIFTTDQVLEAELDLYDHGREPVADPLFELRIYQGEDLFYEKKTRERSVCIPLDAITRSVRLAVELRVGEFCNTWNVYAFTEPKEPPDVRLIGTREELLDIKKTGGRAIVTPDCIGQTRACSFIPVFWSPVHFPSEKPCGAIIDAGHPLFADFPTERYPDYQWKHLLDHARAADISGFGTEVRPIVEMVPNFVDNISASPLFEFRAGAAKLLYCGFDLTRDEPATRQMKAAVYSYVDSARFSP
jgi:hypothetical protein